MHQHCGRTRIVATFMAAAVAITHTGTTVHAVNVKVFGLGPGRTGTDSLREALVELGVGPTYHMKELLFDEAGISTEGHMKIWEDAANLRPVDFPALLADWPSGVDYPLSSFPEELLAAFPDAKFILTKRPAEQWFRSMNATICGVNTEFFPFSVLSLLPFGPFKRFKEQTPMMNAVIKNKFAAGFADSLASLCGSQTDAVAALEAWNARVEALIPPQQLLVFELGTSGYSELSEFLGVPDPNKPYPRVNSTEFFKKLLLGFRVLAVLLLVAGPMLVLYLVRVLVRLGSNKGAGGNDKRGKQQ